MRVIKHIKDLIEVAKDSGIAEALRYDWRKTRGDKTDVPAMKACMNKLGCNLTSRGLYERFVNHVRKGSIVFEDVARSVTEYYGFSLEPLEEALSIGRRIEYNEDIKGLRTRFESGAIGGVSPEYTERKLRDVAQKYGFSVKPLEEVLKLYDPRKEAAVHLAIGRLGFGNTAIAEEIAAKHGFSLDELEKENGM